MSDLIKENLREEKADSNNPKEKFKHYVWYLVAKLKRKIKEAQNNKNSSSRQEDDAYKMGYLMALYHMKDEMEIFASDFDIERKEIGLDYDVKEIVINFIINLSYISKKSYQKRIEFNGHDYEGEFDQLNSYLVDQSEIIPLLAKFKEKHQPLLLKFYSHIEPFYQDYDGLYKSQKKQSWKEIVKIANDILEAFNFRKNPRLLKSELEVELNKNEYDYLSQAPFLPKCFKKWYFFDKQTKDTYLLKIPPSWADEIRDLCGTQLQIIGFDKKYEPTEEGKILEILIDKFFVGFFNGENKEKHTSKLRTLLTFRRPKKF